MKKNIITMDVMIHIAAQYLAQAGNSFLKLRPDGSQRAISFCTNGHCLQTVPLNLVGDRLCLNYDDFSLQWKNEETHKMKLYLDQKTHKEILEWIERTVIELNLNTGYSYSFNTKLPYTPITDDFRFKIVSKERLNLLLSYRMLTQQALETIIEKHQISIDIAIWPLDFNTSAFTLLNSNIDITLCFGMTVYTTEKETNSHHLYIKGWHGMENMPTTNFPNLGIGNWNAHKDYGARLSLQHVTKQDIVDFFETTMHIYMNQCYQKIA